MNYFAELNKSVIKYNNEDGNRDQFKIPTYTINNRIPVLPDRIINNWLPREPITSHFCFIDGKPIKINK